MYIYTHNAYRVSCCIYWFFYTLFILFSYVHPVRFRVCGCIRVRRRRRRRRGQCHRGGWQPANWGDWFFRHAIFVLTFSKSLCQLGLPVTNRRRRRTTSKQRGHPPGSWIARTLTANSTELCAQLLHSHALIVVAFLPLEVIFFFFLFVFSLLRLPCPGTVIHV